MVCIDLMFQHQGQVYRITKSITVNVSLHLYSCVKSHRSCPRPCWWTEHEVEPGFRQLFRLLGILGWFAFWLWCRGRWFHHAWQEALCNLDKISLAKTLVIIFQQEWRWDWLLTHRILPWKFDFYVNSPFNFRLILLKAKNILLKVQTLLLKKMFLKDYTMLSCISPTCLAMHTARTMGVKNMSLQKYPSTLLRTQLE